MTFQLVCIEPKELTQYKADMQEAFQKGFEDAFGKTDAVILPEKDIDQSVNAEGSAVYKAVVDGEMVGGAVVIINESTQHNHLDLLFVKNGVQSKGIGKKIWFELERIYPNTKVWETCTPYFDKRNIHFYVNVCGFHITEFFNEKHPMPDTPDDFVGDGNHRGVGCGPSPNSLPRDDGERGGCHIALCGCGRLPDLYLLPGLRQGHPR